MLKNWPFQWEFFPFCGFRKPNICQFFFPRVNRLNFVFLINNVPSSEKIRSTESKIKIVLSELVSQYASCCPFNTTFLYISVDSKSSVIHFISKVIKPKKLIKKAEIHVKVVCSPGIRAIPNLPIWLGLYDVMPGSQTDFTSGLAKISSHLGGVYSSF